MTVSLTKGQRVSLSKDGAVLSRIFMGLGWDVARKGGFFGGLLRGNQEIDLDASCLVFNEAGQLVDEIWFRQLHGMNGAIVHTGDNLTGAGDGDDEVIQVDLVRLPASIKSLVFTVTSFHGQTFDNVANARCRVVDDVSGKELTVFNLSDSGPHTGFIMAKIYRHNGVWKIHAIGERTNGRTFYDMMPAIQAVL